MVVQIPTFHPHALSTRVSNPQLTPLKACMLPNEKSVQSVCFTHHIATP